MNLPSSLAITGGAGILVLAIPAAIIFICGALLLFYYKHKKEENSHEEKRNEHKDKDKDNSKRDF